MKHFTKRRFSDTQIYFFNLKHKSHQYLFIVNNQVGMWVLTDFLSPAYDLVSTMRYPCFRNKQKTEQMPNLKIRPVTECLQLCNSVYNSVTSSLLLQHCVRIFLTSLEIHILPLYHIWAAQKLLNSFFICLIL